MNGGKCSTRDKCQCPPNFTGKFCQMPVQNGHQQQQSSVGFSQTQVHSTHTLPLTYSNGQNPGECKQLVTLANSWVSSVEDVGGKVRGVKRSFYFYQ